MQTNDNMSHFRADSRQTLLAGWLAVDVKVDENCRKAGSQIYLTWQRHQRR